KDDVKNAKRFRQRWAGRLVPDELSRYSQDGLLRIEYKPQYPVQISVSPALATLRTPDRDCRTDRLLASRSRQVLELLKDNIRSTVRVQEAELTATLGEKGSRSRSQARPLRSPQVLSRGTVQWLSNKTSGRIISVILPVKNGAEKLPELLSAIRRQRTLDQ